VIPKLTEVFHFKATPEQARAIKRMAKARRMHVGAWLRSVVVAASAPLSSNGSMNLDTPRLPK